MVAPDPPGNPARNHLFGTIRLFFHMSHGHALPSPPRTMAPHAGFQLLSHELLALARTHPTSQATGVSLAISTQVGIQTSTRTARQKKDSDKNKGTGGKVIHDTNTITYNHPGSQLPIQHQAAFPKTFLHPCQGNPETLHCTRNTPKTFTAIPRGNLLLKCAYPRGAKVSPSGSSDLASMRV